MGLRDSERGKKRSYKKQTKKEKNHRKRAPSASFLERQRGTEAAAAWSGDGRSSAEKVSGGSAAAAPGTGPHKRAADGEPRCQAVPDPAREHARHVRRVVVAAPFASTPTRVRRARHVSVRHAAPPARFRHLGTSATPAHPPRPWEQPRWWSRSKRSRSSTVAQRDAAVCAAQLPRAPLRARPDAAPSASRQPLNS